eukprot:scaffold5318_cov59-Cylindrotheca_fusiformis.AAC.2
MRRSQVLKESLDAVRRPAVPSFYEVLQSMRRVGLTQSLLIPIVGRRALRREILVTLPDR